jgi:repressor LexA
MICENELPKLTRRQQEVFKFITRYHAKKGYSPSIRDICKGVKLSSSSSVHLHLKTLEDKGFIRRDPTKPRTIEILHNIGLNQVNNENLVKEKVEEETIEIKREQIQEPEKIQESIAPISPFPADLEYKIVECPLYKSYAPGTTFFDKSNIDTNYYLPLPIIGKEDAFLLRMNNDSMTGAGIFPDDLCIFYPSETFDDGDIAAVYSGGTLTIKRIHRALGAYRLDPENRKMNPVFVKKIELLGILQGILRPPSENSPYARKRRSM